MKIEYNSGVYQLVAVGGPVYTYKANGKLIDCFIGSTSRKQWKNFIIKYIGEELYNNIVANSNS